MLVGSPSEGLLLGFTLVIGEAGLVVGALVDFCGEGKLKGTIV